MLQQWTGGRVQSRLLRVSAGSRVAILLLPTARDAHIPAGEPGRLNVIPYGYWDWRGLGECALVHVSSFRQASAITNKF